MSETYFTSPHETGFVKSVLPRVAEAANRLPVGADTYSMFVYGRNFKPASDTAMHEHRVFINGAYQILCEQFNISPVITPFRRVVVWPQPEDGWTPDHRNRLRLEGYRHLNPLPLSGLNSHTNLTRFIFLDTLEGDSIRDYFIPFHELTHSIERHIGVKFPDKSFFHEGFADMGYVLGLQAIENIVKPTPDDIMPEDFDSFAQIMQVETTDTSQPEIRYNNANGWFFRYLFELKGIEGLRHLAQKTNNLLDLISNRNKTKQKHVSHLLEETYNVPLADLLADAKRWLFDDSKN